MPFPASRPLSADGAVPACTRREVRADFRHCDHSRTPERADSRAKSPLSSAAREVEQVPQHTIPGRPQAIVLELTGDPRAYATDQAGRLV